MCCSGDATCVQPDSVSGTLTFMFRISLTYVQPDSVSRTLTFMLRTSLTCVQPDSLSGTGQQTSQTNSYPDSLNENNLFVIATSNLPIVPSLHAVNQRTDREQSCRSLRLFKLSRRPEGLKTKLYWELTRAPRVSLQHKSSSKHFSPLIV